MVLDLDETLIHSSNKLADKDFDMKVSVPNRDGKMGTVVFVDPDPVVSAAAPQRVPARTE